MSWGYGYGFGDWGYSYAGYYGYGYGYGLYGYDSYYGTWWWTDVMEPAEQNLPTGFWKLGEQIHAVKFPTSNRAEEMMFDSWESELVPDAPDTSHVFESNVPSPPTEAPPLTLGHNMERTSAPTPKPPVGASQNPPPAEMQDDKQHVSIGWFVNKLVTDVAIPLVKAIKQAAQAIPNPPEEEAPSPSDLSWSIGPTLTFGPFRVPGQREPVDTPQNVANARLAIRAGEKDVPLNDRVHGDVVSAAVGFSDLGVPNKYVVPVGWTFNRNAGAYWREQTAGMAANPLVPLNDNEPSRGLTGTTVRIGVRANDGWVAIDPAFGGGRATFKALESLAERLKVGASSDPLGTIRTAIASVRSPFELSFNQNASVAFFVDGTGNSLESLTNVVRLYNAYEGSKFYYGGVGNFIDWTAENEWIDSRYLVDPDILKKTGGNASGFGTDNLVDRVVADVTRYLKLVYSQQPHFPLESFPIDLFGFSRGSAASAEVAMRLSKGITIDGRKVIPQVRVLGLYDPVYSIFLPGQSSSKITASPESAAGNFVYRELAPNVKTLIDLAAQHEERTYFPATKYLSNTPGQVLEQYALPGAHCDVGGHYGSNEFTVSV